MVQIVFIFRNNRAMARRWMIVYRKVHSHTHICRPTRAGGAGLNPGESLPSTLVFFLPDRSVFIDLEKVSARIASVAENLVSKNIRIIEDLLKTL